jgi:hypothetical protein
VEVAGKGADPVPDSGPGAGRKVAVSIELPELSSVALRFPANCFGMEVRGFRGFSLLNTHMWESIVWLDVFLGFEP